MRWPPQRLDSARLPATRRDFFTGHASLPGHRWRCDPSANAFVLWPIFPDGARTNFSRSITVSPERISCRFRVFASLRKSVTHWLTARPASLFFSWAPVQGLNISFGRILISSAVAVGARAVSRNQCRLTGGAKIPPTLVSGVSRSCPSPLVRQCFPDFWITDKFPGRIRSAMAQAGRAVAIFALVQRPTSAPPARRFQTPARSCIFWIVDHRWIAECRVPAGVFPAVSPNDSSNVTTMPVF